MERETPWSGPIDAGWGGVLAGQFDTEPRKPTYVRIPGNWSKTPPGVAPDQVTLALIGDALALLNHRQRWGVTFSTYYSDMLAASGCSWRFVIDGSPAAATWPPHNANFIDLVDLDENKLRDHGKFVAIARGEDIPQPGPSPGPVPTTITAPGSRPSRIASSTSVSRRTSRARSSSAETEAARTTSHKHTTPAPARITRRF